MLNPKDYFARIKQQLDDDNQDSTQDEQASESAKFQLEVLEQLVMLSGTQPAVPIDAPVNVAGNLSDDCDVLLLLKEFVCGSKGDDLIDGFVDDKTTAESCEESPDGLNQNGFDSKGFNQAGFDIHGYDLEGLDVSGFDVNGYNRDGLDINGNRDCG